MNNIYKNSKEFPYHISVGAIFFREDGSVACQHYAKETVLNITGIERDVYTLMRETMEDGESVVETLHRGLQEEVGVECVVLGYLGSLETHVFNETEAQPENFKKTTLYFLVDLLPNQTLRGLSEDGNATFTNEWMNPMELIERMEMQLEGLKRTDLNEAEIIRRALQVRQEK